MTARRLVLAWASGATVGYLVGWLAGSNVQRLAEGRRLAADYMRNEGAPMSAERRARLMAHTPARTAVRLPEPRRGAGTGTSATEAGSGAQTGAQWLDQDELHARPDYQEAFRRAEGRPWEPGVDLVAYMADHDIPAQRACEPCPQYSPGGGIPCSVTGVHTAHIFLGSCAPDAKDDADEEVE